MQFFVNVSLKALFRMSQTNSLQMLNACQPPSSKRTTRVHAGEGVLLTGVHYIFGQVSRMTNKTQAVLQHGKGPLLFILRHDKIHY